MCSDFENKTILLTGGTGFLGSSLAKRICTRYQLIVLKRSFSDITRISGIMQDIISYDIDKTSFEDIFSRHTIDCIVHTATNYGRNTSLLSQIIEDNLLFPMRLVEHAIAQKISCFINTDTFFAKMHYNYSFLKEYILTKRQLADWLKNIADRIAIINMRLEHVYGQGDACEKFIPAIIKRLIASEKTIKLTDGRQMRDFVYIEDVADAYELIIKHMCYRKGGFIEMEVGSGKAVSLRYLIEVAKKLTKSRSQLDFGAIEHRDGEIMHSQANTASLKKLGWQPAISLEEGLKKTIEHVLSLEL